MKTLTAVLVEVVGIIATTAVMLAVAAAIALALTKIAPFLP
jgi:hypothetical protein